jgi:hypothetical protein
MSVNVFRGSIRHRSVIWLLALLLVGSGAAAQDPNPQDQADAAKAKQEELKKKAAERDAEAQRRREEFDKKTAAMREDAKRREEAFDEKIKKSMTPEKFAEYKRRKEEQRKEMEARSEKNRREFDELRKRNDADFAAREKAEEAARLRYHFVVGQMFAYHVEITVDRGDLIERFAGAAVFTPKYVEKQGQAELLCAGRLAYSTRNPGGAGGDGEFKEVPNQAIWVNPRIVMNSSAKSVGGRPDFTKSTLPETLFNAVPLKEFFFVELPDKPGGKIRSEGGAMIWLTGGQNPLFGPNFKTMDGTAKYSVETEELPDGLIRIRKEKSFKDKDRGSVWAKYESTARFDRKRGLLIDSDAVFTHQLSAVPNPPVKITLRLLEGDAVAKAFEQAKKDWLLLPAGLDPAEFRRIRLDLDKAEHFKSVDDVKAGMTVAYLGDDRHWYQAKVDGIYSEYKVGIRMDGSKEDFTVHPGQLAAVPAEKTPAKK